jgi:hypothetical protein
MLCLKPKLDQVYLFLNQEFDFDVFYGGENWWLHDNYVLAVSIND